MSSLTDTIDALVAASVEAQRDMRWFMGALPGMCATEAASMRVIAQRVLSLSRFLRSEFLAGRLFLTQDPPSHRECAIVP